MSDKLQLIGTVGFIVSAVAANAFVILYTVLARWWRHEMGVHLFSFMLVVALILDHSALTLVWRDYPGRLWVRAALLPALAIVLSWRVLILLRAQLKERKSSATGDTD